MVLGALSPRTRNAQVAMYQNGDVEYLVATDAIGMGLNLDVDHVAFAQDRKFDGFQFRNLNPGELAQVAGRAGRHMRDGTFGVTGRVNPFEEELVERIESHEFEPVKVLQWRSKQLDFSSVGTLCESLDAAPVLDGLGRALPAVERQGPLKAVALGVLEPRLAGGGGLLQLHHVQPPGVVVGLQHGGHVARAALVERLDQRDGVLHGQLGARADGEVGGVDRVPEEDDVLVVPPFAGDRGEAPPDGPVGEELVAVEMVGETGAACRQPCPPRPPRRDPRAARCPRDTRR